MHVKDGVLIGGDASNRRHRDGGRSSVTRTGLWLAVVARALVAFAAGIAESDLVHFFIASREVTAPLLTAVVVVLGGTAGSNLNPRVGYATRTVWCLR